MRWGGGHWNTQAGCTFDAAGVTEHRPLRTWPEVHRALVQLGHCRAGELDPAPEVPNSAQAPPEAHQSARASARLNIELMNRVGPESDGVGGSERRVTALNDVEVIAPDFPHKVDVVRAAATTFNTWINRQRKGTGRCCQAECG